MAIINAKLNESEDINQGQSIYVEAKDSILKNFKNRKIIQLTNSPHKVQDKYMVNIPQVVSEKPEKFEKN